MSDRRYSEDEVAEIFDRATRVDPERRALGSGRGEPASSPGMTLAELQRIGAEVGIPAEAIAASARAVDLQARPPEVNQTLLGLPIGVSSTAPLPRRLSDDEWARLVARIRDEFSAHGTVEEAGPLKSWRNGNLRIQLEPTAEGQQLRMQTYKQSARGMVQAGGALLGTGAVLGTVSILAGDAQAALATFSMLSLMGGGMIGSAALSLRGWARRRRDQMRRIGEVAAEMAGRALPPGPAPDGGE